MTGKVINERAYPSWFRITCMLVGFTLFGLVILWSIQGQRPNRTGGVVSATDEPWSFWIGNLLVLGVGGLWIYAPYRNRGRLDNQS